MIGLPTAQEALIARSRLYSTSELVPVRELPYELRLNVFLMEKMKLILAGAAGAVESEGRKCFSTCS